MSIWFILTLYYKMRQKFITKCVKFFVTKHDDFIRNATFITKCDVYYKLRQYNHSKFPVCYWFSFDSLNTDEIGETALLPYVVNPVTVAEILNTVSRTNKYILTSCRATVVKLLLHGGESLDLMTTFYIKSICWFYFFLFFFFFFILFPILKIYI